MAGEFANLGKALEEVYTRDRLDELFTGENAFRKALQKQAEAQERCLYAQPPVRESEGGDSWI